MDSWVPSLIATLFCLVVGGNQYRLSDLGKNQAKETKRLDERITTDTAKSEERQQNEHKSLSADINMVSSRLTTRIEQISKDVVFTDVFIQHEKVDETNAKHNEKMFELLEKQLEGVVSSNTNEHSRLGEKLDDIPRMIREEIQNAMKQGEKS